MGVPTKANEITTRAITALMKVNITKLSYTCAVLKDLEEDHETSILVLEDRIENLKSRIKDLQNISAMKLGMGALRSLQIKAHLN